jgi:hypothetical protein
MKRGHRRTFVESVTLSPMSKRTENPKARTMPGVGGQSPLRPSFQTFCLDMRNPSPVMFAPITCQMLRILSMAGGI